MKAQWKIAVRALYKEIRAMGYSPSVAIKMARCNRTVRDYYGV